MEDKSTFLQKARPCNTALSLYMDWWREEREEKVKESSDSGFFKHGHFEKLDQLKRLFKNFSLDCSASEEEDSPILWHCEQSLGRTCNQNCQS